MKPRRRFRLITRTNYRGTPYYYVEQRVWWWPFWTSVLNPSGTVTWGCGPGDDGHYIAEHTIRECKQFDAYKNTTTIQEIP